MEGFPLGTRWGNENGWEGSRGSRKRSYGSKWKLECMVKKGHGVYLYGSLGRKVVVVEGGEGVRGFKFWVRVLGNPTMGCLYIYCKVL